MGAFFLKPLVLLFQYLLPHYIKGTQPFISPSKSTKLRKKISVSEESSSKNTTHFLAMSKGTIAAKKAWIVATTIGAVEALKDQGICRWNYTIRSLHQHAKNNLRSSSLFSSSSSSAGAVSSMLREERRRKAEKNMKKVMELNSWGPSTVRF